MFLSFCFDVSTSESLTSLLTGVIPVKSDVKDSDVLICMTRKRHVFFLFCFVVVVVVVIFETVYLQRNKKAKMAPKSLT